jgi:transposase
MGGVPRPGSHVDRHGTEGAPVRPADLQVVQGHRLGDGAGDVDLGQRREMQPQPEPCRTGRELGAQRHAALHVQDVDDLVERARWRGEKLYVVCDNFSPHRHARVHDWCAANAVELVFLPTYGSWLNWIEAEFAALRYFARGGTDHRSHDEQNAAIAAYVRWGNARAQPKTNFAVDSTVRTWTDYPIKAA